MLASTKYPKQNLLGRISKYKDIVSVVIVCWIKFDLMLLTFIWKSVFLQEKDNKSSETDFFPSTRT